VIGAGAKSKKREVEQMYCFDENTAPKEIIAAAMSEIAETMKADGFKLLKNLEIKKKTEAFTFRVYPQSNSWNARGRTAEMWIHCSVHDDKDKECFWGHTLAFSNAKQDTLHPWEFYGKDNYDKSLIEIKEIISCRLLPFFRKFEQGLEAFVEEVTEKGFCAFGDLPVYDAEYSIPVTFLLKYGTKEHLQIAFQNYIDRHQLRFVKPNMEKAIALLREGKEVIKNGEKYYAEIAVKHGLELVF